MVRADTGGTAEVGDAPVHTPWEVVAEIFRIALSRAPAGPIPVARELTEGTGPGR
ncbi:hypothetical protein ACFVGY_13455 [Streptomyces sp. NPDC127106]|uniref:hypothetical protein n=1 Tax=Streptomyces sp. NPDC127106 TaxID=3345360 RepID=UPI003633709B